MQVELQLSTTDVPERRHFQDRGALRYHIARRLRFSLSRIAEHIDQVSALVTGTPGRNVQCQLSADVGPFGQLTVQVSAPDLMNAIEKAVGMLTLLLEQHQERGRDSNVSRESPRLVA